MVKNSQYFEKNLIMFSSEFNKGYFTISGWLNKSFNLILSWSTYFTCVEIFGSDIWI